MGGGGVVEKGVKNRRKRIIYYMHFVKQGKPTAEVSADNVHEWGLVRRLDNARVGAIKVQRWVRKMSRVLGPPTALGLKNKTNKD